ncbi:MAG TPA: hypothetical protein VK041_07160 [Opitutales bacterium]|nr:hypothetical protein [Opitutales bacterium]
MDKKLQEIEKYREKIADLEREMENERRQKLLDLHEQLGYDSRQDLIEALQKLPGGRRGRRTVITPELRSKISDALKAGEEAGTAIARRFGVSVATVQNIKKDLGLVQPRKR